MLLFADLPDTIEIDACLEDSTRMLTFTPPSFLPANLRPVESVDPTCPEFGIELLQRKRELVGRLSLDDFKRMKKHTLLLDVRYEWGCVADAVGAG